MVSTICEAGATCVAILAAATVMVWPWYELTRAVIS